MPESPEFHGNPDTSGLASSRLTSARLSCDTRQMIPDFAPRGVWRNPHVQTLSAAMPWGAPPADVRLAHAVDALIPLPKTDDALLARAWWHVPPITQAPLVLVMHGVGGTSESRYVQRAAAHCYRAGFHVVRLNARGYGLGVAHARRVAHGALFRDLRAAVTWCATQPDVGAVHVLGFSLGGHVALHLAASCHDDPLPALRSVTAISPPLDLTIVSRHFERPAVTPYRAHVLRGLRRDVRAQLARDARALPVGEDDVRRWRQVRDYDDRVLAPMWGFASAATYYAASSVALRLPAITLPTLLLYALDDPMVTPEAVLPFLAAAGPGVQPHITRHGGHCGFADSWRALGRGETWASSAALTFMRQLADGPRAG